MYIRITSRCNMKCEHCCYSCEPGKGEDMSMETFRAALMLSDHVILGGGEPTIHPQFEKMLLEAMAAACDGEEFKVFVVTNGSIKHRAVMLACLAKNGVINAEVSTDYYHDREMVSEEVFEAFGERTRDVTAYGEPRPVGRYLETLGLSFEDIDDKRCACDEFICNPDGTIYQCGCPDAPIVGNVKTGLIGLAAYTSSDCFHSEEYADQVEEYNSSVNRVTFDVRSGRGNGDDQGGFDDVIEIVTRSIRQHSGWQSVRYKAQRYHLHGGVRTHWWINVNRPIRSKAA